MSTIMPNPEDCQHARVRSHRWAEPGGIVCALSRDWDGCGAEHGECPRLHPSKRFCPKCFEDGYVSTLTHDEDEDVYGCDECCTMFWPDQLEDKWQEMEQRFQDTCKAREVA